MNKWTNSVMDDDRWVHPLAWTLPSLVNNLWWNIVMDDGGLDENSLNEWQYLQHHKIVILQKTHKEWQMVLVQHLVLVTLYCGLQVVLRKTIRIGDTNYHV